MDLSSLIGTIMAIFAFVFGVFSGAKYSFSGLIAMWDVPSFIITVVGSLGSTFISHPKERSFKLFSYYLSALKEKKLDSIGTLQTLYGFAEKARRDGMISLEEEIVNINDEFMKAGLRAAVDGTDSEDIQKILEIKMELFESDEESKAAVLETWNAYGPAFGMIGTLIGLVLLLGQLNDPSAIGPYMAVALVTTLYGALIANIFANPTQEKLKRRIGKELNLKRMVLEGIISIVQGENPRLMEEKLKAFLTEEERAVYDKSKGTEI